MVQRSEVGNLTIEMRNVDSSVGQSPTDFGFTDWTVQFLLFLSLVLEKASYNGVLLNSCLFISSCFFPPFTYRAHTESFAQLEVRP